MRARIWMAIASAAVIWVASLATVSAAYTTSTVSAIYRNELGTVTGVEVTFTGDAGEKPQRAVYAPGSGTAAEEAVSIRQWRDAELSRLNNRAALGALPALQVGQAIPAAPAPPDQTAANAKRSWVDRFFAVYMATNSGFDPAGAIMQAVVAQRIALDNEFKALSPAEKLDYVRSIRGLR